MMKNTGSSRFKQQILEEQLIESIYNDLKGNIENHKLFDHLCDLGFDELVKIRKTIDSKNK